MEQISGICPQCGNMLQIPGGLEEFSCLYCGARLTAAQLLPQEEATQDAGASELCFRAYAGDVLRTVTDYPNVMEKMSRKLFSDYYAAYSAACVDPFAHLEQAVLQQSERRDEIIDRAAAELLNQLAQWLDAKGLSKKKYRLALDDAKYTIALLLVPAVRGYGLSISEQYCRRLHALWLQTYPDARFELCTAEELFQGFQRKLCFITTAVCREEGKPDDCAELQAFRAFRDGYLMACQDGPELIAEYYDWAPGIVSCIDYCEDSAAVYRRLREQWLQPCYADLQRGALASCKTRYAAMVRQLQHEFLHIEQ